MFNWIWTRVQIVGLADGESELAADTPDSASKFSFPLAVELRSFLFFLFLPFISPPQEDMTRKYARNLFLFSKRP
jgi:hypothetical protein